MNIFDSCYKFPLSVEQQHLAELSVMGGKVLVCAVWWPPVQLSDQSVRWASL